MKLSIAILAVSVAASTNIELQREKLSRALKIGANGSAVRQGNSLCSLRSISKADQCCDGVDLECFGCNPLLFTNGQLCEDQTTNHAFAERRDCFCDSSCILFEDCCDDHVTTCAHLYSNYEPSTTIESFTTETTTIKVTLSSLSLHLQKNPSSFKVFFRRS